jgi:chlorophyll(ide) b reductase
MRGDGDVSGTRSRTNQLCNVSLRVASCRYARPVGVRGLRSRGVQLHYVCQIEHSKWPSSMLIRGKSNGKRRLDMHGLHFSNSDLLVGQSHIRKFQCSKGDMSSTSDFVEDQEECLLGSFPSNVTSNGQLASEGEENSVDEETSSMISKDVSLAEVMSEDVAISPIRRVDIAARKFVKSVVRTLSGASLKEQDAVVQNDPIKSPKLAWNPLSLLYQTDPSPTAAWRKKFADGWRMAETDFFSFSRQLGKYVFIMSGTGAMLVAGLELGGGSPHEQGVLGFSWLAGVLIGSMIGAGQVLKEHAMAGRRNVIVTGSTRGLGKALAREFLLNGDNVVVTSRSAHDVQSTVEELRKEIQDFSGSLSKSDARMELFGLPSPKRSDPRVIGIPCDVSNSKDVEALALYAVKEFGSVDLWINNAGVNKGFRPLLEFTGEEIEQIVSTNLTGSMICTREAIKVMQTQKKGGHIFNMDGAGSGGSSTPLTAAYGATKCGLRQMSSSLQEEVKGSDVGIHTASPGMVLTDLLLSGASLQNKKMFNFICEQPETVARALVPNLRLVTGTGKAVNYLTPARIVFAIVSLWIRRGRWFDEEGRAVYAAEAERLRLWAEGRERSPVTAAMELVPSGTWVSIFSSSVICAYLILTSASNGNLPGV